MTACWLRHKRESAVLWRWGNGT